MTKEGSTNCIFKDPPPNRGFCARALKGEGGGKRVVLKSYVILMKCINIQHIICYFIKGL